VRLVLKGLEGEEGATWLYYPATSSSQKAIYYLIVQAPHPVTLKFYRHIAHLIPTGSGPYRQVYYLL